MSAPFRSVTPSRTYRFAAAETPVTREPLLAPDITTAMQHNSSRPGTLPPTAARPAVASAAQGATQTSILETRHPEIARAVSLLWGYPEMNEYFDRLWLADGSQGPIDPDAMSELMLLARVHQMLLPQRPGRSLASIYGSNRLYETSPGARDPWSDVPPRR